MKKNTKKLIEKFIKDRFTFTMASSINNIPEIFTGFYITEDAKTLYFKSSTSSKHSTIFKENPNAAVAIYDHNSTYVGRKAGIQSIGKISRVTDIDEMTKIVKLYITEFKGAEKKLKDIPNLISIFVKSTMYKYEIEKIKMIDSDKEIQMTEYQDWS